MNRNKLFHSIKDTVESGCDVDFGKLTICDLGNHSATRKLLERKYQVHCDDPRMKWSEIYYKLDIAVDKFMVIRSVLLKDKDAN
jgi:hypothetical protein